MKFFHKIKCNKGSSAIILVILGVILTSMFIVMSMNQIGNQMKSTRNRSEDIELKYVAEAGIETIIGDIYNQIQTNGNEEISKFKSENNAIIQYDSSTYKESSMNNYMISHLNDAANMYLDLSEDIRDEDSELADDILNLIYKPIATQGYEMDGKNLTLIGWAKEAQEGDEGALNLIIKVIGMNSNTDITPDYDGNNEVPSTTLPTEPELDSGQNLEIIKVNIDKIRGEISSKYSVEFEKAEYILNIALYTANHMLHTHEDHIISGQDINKYIFQYMEEIENGALTDAYGIIGSYNGNLSQQIQIIQSKISAAAQSAQVLINQDSNETRARIIESINIIITDITKLQVDAMNTKFSKINILLEKTKRQLTEVKCRLGNVNLGGSEVIPGEPEGPTDPPNPNPGQKKSIIIPVNVNKEKYKDVIVYEEKSYELNQDIKFELEVVVELVSTNENNKNIYNVILDESILSRQSTIKIDSKDSKTNSGKYNIKSDIKFSIEELDTANIKPVYEIITWDY